MRAQVLPSLINLNSSELTGEKSTTRSISALLPGLNLQDFSSSDDLVILPENTRIEPVKRLVVLIPENEFGEIELTRRIWQIASSGSLCVLYLCLSCASSDDDTYLRRRLASLAALTRHEQVQVNAEIVRESSWLDSLKKIVSPGDLLVCSDRHHASHWLIHRKNLGWQLSTTMGIPVYLLVGLNLGPSVHHTHWINEIVYWLAAISILFAFGWFQVQMDRFIDGWLLTVVLLLTVVAEIVFLFKLKDITG
jgi:hypothetical protein